MTQEIQTLTQETPANVLTVIERVALNPAVDVTKMNALLEMQERILDRQAEIEFNTAMSQLRAELNTHPVIKSRKNAQTKSSYADLEDVKMVVDPLLTKYGFFDRYEDDYPAEGVVGTTCIITHQKGHKEKNRVQFRLDDKGIAGSVNKTPVHAMASSMTYGQRLSLCRALGVRISDDDDGNIAGSQTVTDEQAIWIEEMITSTNSDKAKFLEYMGAKTIGNIPAVAFQKAKTMLLDKQARAQNA